MKIKTRIIIAIFALFALGLVQYDYITNFRDHSAYPDQVYANATKYEGRELGLEGEILSIDEDMFILKTPSFVVEVYSSDKGLKKGQYGEFLLKVEGGKIVCKNYRIFKRHYIKYVISILAVIIVILVLLKEFRLTKGGFDYA